MLAEKLTIVVVTYNSMKVLPSFFRHLENALDGEECLILVCDNASNDGIKEFIEEYWPNVNLLRSERNEGYGAALNRGIAACKTQFIALMNPDVVIKKGGFNDLVTFLEERPLAAGVSGAVIHMREYNENVDFNQLLREQPISVHFGYYNLLSRILFYSGIQTKFRQFRFLVQWSLVPACDSISVSRLNGSFGVFRKEALVEVGMFDPRLFLYFEEDDIALRLTKKGYELYVTDRTVIIHTPGKGSALSGTIAADKILLNSQYLFFKKHKGLFYTWVSFFAIWAVLTIVTGYQLIFNRSGSKTTASLWKWHLESLLRWGGVPEGTIPDGGKEDVNYIWTK
jgi:GT2 family glycosyltransferase